MNDGQPGASRESGFLAALRRLATTAVGLLHTRVELVAAELEEERDRLVRLSILIVAAGFFLALGTVTLTFFIIIVAWDTHRVLAAGLLAAAYLGIGAILAVNVRDAVKAQSKLLSATIAELKKDRDELREAWKTPSR